MTHEASRNGKSQPSGSARREKMASSALFAAVLILGTSLGVAAAQLAVEGTAADGRSTHHFSTRLAETKTTAHTNELKTNPLVKTNPPVSKQPVSKGFVYGGSKSKSAPQEQPKR
jgi:hypothetical protein